tara:strand:- start:36268 stop:38460 length:2193 start_codon:yes stop_codon:yes gene_type:complete
MSKAINSILPTTGNADFLVTPEDYLVEIHEMGVCNTNPIKGASNALKQWDKTGNEILYKKSKNGNPLVLNVGPGKRKIDVVLKQPTLGNYKYNYILLKKSIKIKVTGEFQSGEKFFSRNNAKSSKNKKSNRYGQFTENIVNFNFNNKAWDVDDNDNVVPGSSSYFYDATNKVEGLLLDINKTKSTISSSTQFILAVYDSTASPLRIRQNGKMNLIFSTTDSATMSCSDWSQVGNEEVLDTTSIVNVVNSGGNKYLFNNGSSYRSSLKYILPVGTYTLKNVPIGHPIALLNDGQTGEISYSLVNDVNSPIVIKVSGGQTNESNGDYYEFKDKDDNAINIGNGSFKFMRGRTYKFQANNISSSHPFKIYMSGAFQNDNNSNNGGISGSTDSITITIPSNHSTTAGDLYYQCSVHSGMKKNLSLYYLAVTGSTNNASYDFYYGDVKVTVSSNFNKVSLWCYHHGYMGGENLFEYPPPKEDLLTTSIVNVVNSGGNKYVFNNGSSYDSSLRYLLANGTYTLKNVPKAHPIALINNGKTAQISYSLINDENSPIVIKVSGGNTNESNGDYYEFKDKDDNTINIGNGSFLFMRGRTYKFQANNISSSHPFKIYMSSAFQNDNNDSNSGISGSTDSITITIPSNHSTTAGDLYYQCGNHSGMKKNLSLYYLAVNGNSYDFYYGDVTVTVSGNFDKVSVYCYHHGYMGGENLFEYDTDGEQPLIQFNSLPPKYSTVSV